MAEDIAAALDALESAKGPQPMTCRWWADAAPDTLEAVVRNTKRVGHTLVTKTLKAKGHSVTPNGIRDHVAGACDKCQQPTT